MLLFFLINIAVYFLILKINYLYFNQKIYYPFRVAEIYAFIFHNILAFIIMIYFFEIKIILLILFINCLLSYIIYHLANMIHTSPRTKILLDLYHYKKISVDEYNNIYNIDIILNNRLNRIKSSKQIAIDDKIIKLNNKKNTFLNFIYGIFKIIKYF